MRVATSKDSHFALCEDRVFFHHYLLSVCVVKHSNNEIWIITLHEARWMLFTAFFQLTAKRLPMYNSLISDSNKCFVGETEFRIVRFLKLAHTRSPSMTQIFTWLYLLHKRYKKHLESFLKAMTSCRGKGENDLSISERTFFVNNRSVLPNVQFHSALSPSLLISANIKRKGLFKRSWFESCRRCAYIRKSYDGTGIFMYWHHLLQSSCRHQNVSNVPCPFKWLQCRRSTILLCNPLNPSCCAF